MQPVACVSNIVHASASRGRAGAVMTGPSSTQGAVGNDEVNERAFWRVFHHGPQVSTFIRVKECFDAVNIKAELERAVLGFTSSR